MKYKIMKVRAKISFIAFQKQQTIPELLLNRIFKSFCRIATMRSEELGDDADVRTIRQVNNVAFRQITSGAVGNIFHKVMELHAEDLKGLDRRTYERIKYIGLVERSQKNFQKELVEVKDKFGILKIKEVDKYGTGKVSQLRSLFQPARAKDMFTNVSLNSRCQEAYTGATQMENQEDAYHHHLRFNQKMDTLLQLYNNMKIIVNLRAVSHVLLVKVCLAKIKVARQMFIIEVEQGNETYIPHELSQDSLPMNFWYYDPILCWVQDLVSKGKQSLCDFKNEFRLNFYRDNSLEQRILRKLGVGKDRSVHRERQVCKHQAVAQAELKEVMPNKSSHVMGLQRSPYVAIDDNLARLQEHDRIQTINREDARLRAVSTFDEPRFYRQSKRNAFQAQQLVLRYCRRDEINALRQRAVQVKSSFLAKLEFLQGLGRKHDMMARVDALVCETLHQLGDDIGHHHGLLEARSMHQDQVDKIKKSLR